jgi:hypothetical protein
LTGKQTPRCHPNIVFQRPGQLAQAMAFFDPHQADAVDKELQN